MSPYSKGDAQDLSDVLDQVWDPIGVYQGPPDEQAPPGEYGTYAGWIYRDLESGGGKSDVLRHMKAAREAMGLKDVSGEDHRAADLIVEWWQGRAPS
jgi:hypothetical protein